MSNIRDIHIKNFKSIRDAKLENCKRINLFIGPPNSGKSNVLEALSLFAINEKSKLFTDFVRVGLPTTLFYNGNTSRNIEIDLNDSCLLSGKLLDDAVNFNIINEGLQFNSFSVNSKTFSIKNNLNQQQLNVFKNYPAYFSIKNYSFKTNTHYSNEGSNLFLENPHGENLFKVILNNASIVKEITRLLKSFYLQLVFDMANNTYVTQKQIGENVFSMPLFMMSDTLQRLIFYKAAIQSNSNTVLLFEEPEANCYPLHITKMISEIIFDKNNNQFFIATHSPYVISDFMENCKDDVAIFVFENHNEETILHRLSDSEIHEAAQFGYDLFLNLENFIVNA